MLVFSRRGDEVIMIGDSVRITVLRVGNNVARIGIDAPREVAVHRGEVYDRLTPKTRWSNSGTERGHALARVRRECDE